MTQVALQPSPSAVLRSSHCSPGSRTPLPHAVGHTGTDTQYPATQLLLAQLLSFVQGWPEAMKPDRRPILFAASSVNHRFPSRPAAMPYGALFAVGMGNSVIVLGLFTSTRPI